MDYWSMPVPLYPGPGVASPSIYAPDPTPLALRYAKVPPPMTVLNAVSRAREKEAKWRFKAADREKERYRPRTQRSNLLEAMKEMLFQQDFWGWINPDNIEGYYTIFKFPECQPPELLEEAGFSRRFPLTDYPESFWALVNDLWAFQQILNDIIDRLQVCVDLQTDAGEFPHHRLKTLQDDYTKLLSMIEGYISGERNGSLAYPDVDTSSFTMWSLFESAMAGQISARKNIQEMQKSRISRDSMLRILKQQLPLQGNAPLRQHFEAEANKFHDDASVKAYKLFKLHHLQTNQFEKLDEHLQNNMRCTPAAGQLFEENFTTLPNDSIFYGFAMDPAVEQQLELMEMDWDNTDCTPDVVTLFDEIPPLYEDSICYGYGFAMD
ncbi:hypothetical protein N7490_004109 [Penicillium lividum]|nr:hypothetical protein N7490_004109 [Penicillium lividum]